MATMNDPLLTNNEIIDVRDALLAHGAIATLTVFDQNLVRDCEIALGLVPCKPERRGEARGRVTRMVANRRALAEFERTSGGPPPWSDR